MRPSPPIMDRFVVTDHGYETPCWDWTGRMSRVGYGVASYVGFTTKQAHRIMYQVHHGPVSPALYIDHLCRNTRCVNPEHLEPVSPAENVRRGNTARLNKDAAREIRAAHRAYLLENPYTKAGKPRQNVGADFVVGLARKYNVHKMTVQDVIRGCTWKEDVPDV